jgi:hypothetical protein
MALLVCVICGLIYAGFARNVKACNFAIYVSAGLIPAVSLKSYLLRKILLIPSFRIDPYLNHLESFIGYPANRVGQLLAEHHWLLAIARFDYYQAWAPFLVLSLFVVLHQEGLDEAKRVLFSFCVAPILAAPFYVLFPASGPVYAFPNFPDVYRGGAGVIHIAAAPNCIPSLHLSIALLAFTYLKKWRALVGIHVLLTAIATLGLGEHYLIDLVLAVPFTWVLVELCRPALSLGRFPSTA